MKFLRLPTAKFNTIDVKEFIKFEIDDRMNRNSDR